jgi:AcrR family transcriptional regulator
VGAELFAQKSYAATTTRELAKALGVTNGTFYHYFPNKEDLLLAICQESLSSIIAAGEKAIAGIDDDEERVRALIAGHVSAMLGDQDLHRTMLIELRSLDRANLNLVLALRDEYSALVRGVLEQAQGSGFLRSDLDGRMLSLMLLNLLNWTIFWFKRNGAQSREEIAAVVATTFLDGARP